MYGQNPQVFNIYQTESIFYSKLRYNNLNFEKILFCKNIL